MKVYAGMDPRLGLREVIAHAQRVERLGYDGLHVAETVHDVMRIGENMRHAKRSSCGSRRAT